MYKKLILLMSAVIVLQTVSAQSARSGNKKDTALTGYTIIDGKTYVPVDADSKLFASELTWTNNKKFDKATVKEREINMELNADNARMFILDNENRNIEIKTWSQSKVKITTTVFIDGTSELQDKQWFEKMNINPVQTGSSLRLRLRGSNGVFSGYSYNTTIVASGYSYSTGESPSVVYDANGNAVGTTNASKKAVTVYVPAGIKLELDNRYGNISVNGKLSYLDLTTNGGTVDLDDVTNLKLRSSGTNFSAQNIGEAEIELTGGRFNAGNIDKLDIDTKTSTVEINSVDDAVIRSSNDQYDIEEAGSIRGRKNYGNIRITILKKALDLEGVNADIRVRNIDAAVENIRIDNKYADIRLPMKQIKNFTVDFRGGYNTVYAPFEKIPMKVEEKQAGEKDNTTKSTTLPASAHVNGYVTVADGMFVTTDGGSAPTRFTATGGDTKGKHTAFIITCSSCTVDFK
jgi:hypothetical protein